MPEDVPQAVVDAAQTYDYVHRSAQTWQRAPDSQVRRLLAGAWNELQREAVKDAAR